jgi:hypothetical protein
MIFATGGLASGATSTRSKSFSCAKRIASSIRITPICSPFGPTKRTSGTRIRSLIRGSTLIPTPFVSSARYHATNQRSVKFISLTFNLINLLNDLKGGISPLVYHLSVIGLQAYQVSFFELINPILVGQAIKSLDFLSIFDLFL